MASASQLRIDVGIWMVNNGKTKRGQRIRAYVDKKKTGTRIKVCGHHLTDDEARELEFHMDELGYDVLKVEKTTRKPNAHPHFSVFTGFTVRVGH